METRGKRVFRLNLVASSAYFAACGILVLIELSFGSSLTLATIFYLLSACLVLTIFYFGFTGLDKKSVAVLISIVTSAIAIATTIVILTNVKLFLGGSV